MNKYSWLLKFPSLYAWLASKKSSVNYEKLLYLRSIKTGDVIFDIGANIGYYSILFAKLCGENGCVHCFEPVPETYQKLLQNLGSCKNAKLNNLAAADFEDTFEMSFDPNDPEKASLSFTPVSSELSRKVKVIPLDNYAKKIKLERLDFLKCDTEGYELQAIKGMVNTLSTHLPKLCIEITLNRNQKVELLELLLKIGYDSFQKVEKGFPTFDLKQEIKDREDYFYLYATSSLAP